MNTRAQDALLAVSMGYCDSRQCAIEIMNEVAEMDVESCENHINNWATHGELPPDQQQYVNSVLKYYGYSENGYVQ